MDPINNKLINWIWKIRLKKLMNNIDVQRLKTENTTIKIIKTIKKNIKKILKKSR